MTRTLRRTLIAVGLAAAAVLGPAGTASAMPCEDTCPGGSYGGGGGGGAPPTVTITATLKYLDIYQGRSSRPLRRDKVEVWRYLPRLGFWAWGNDRTLYTDDQGRLSTSFTNDYDGTVYALRVVAENSAAWVRPNPDTALAWVPATLGFNGAFWREPGDDHPIEPVGRTTSQTFDLSWTFGGWSAQHYNIADALLYAHDYAAARRGDTDPLPEANVAWWGLGVSGDPFYNPVGSTLTLPSGLWNSEQFAYDDAGLIHEYGHFLEHHLGAFYAMPSVHTGCDGINQQHAWMEGFADYYSAAVLASLPADTLYRVGAFDFAGNFYVVELSPACSRSSLDGRALENRVASVLWDLSDPAGAEAGGYDPAPAQDAAVFQIMDRDLDPPAVATNGGAGCPALLDFRRAWIARGYSASDIDAVFALNAVPTQDYPQAVPPFCTAVN